MEVYTNEQWMKDRVLAVKVGQHIADEVFQQLLNALPPRKWTKSVFQPGEAYGFDCEKKCQTYLTFAYNDEKRMWKYIGLMP